MNVDVSVVPAGVDTSRVLDCPKSAAVAIPDAVFPALQRPRLRLPLGGYSLAPMSQRLVLVRPNLSVVKCSDNSAPASMAATGPIGDDLSSPKRFQAVLEAGRL